MKMKRMRVFTRAGETSSTAETNSFCWGLASKFSLRLSDYHPVRGLVLDKNVKELLALDPAAEKTASDCYLVGQIRSLFSKRKDLDLGADREAAALAAFMDAERLCSETRDIFRMRDEGTFCLYPRVAAVLHSAQRKIAQILGDVPPLSELEYRFSTGATSSIKKQEATAAVKLSRPLTCSVDMLPHSREILDDCPGWLVRDPIPDQCVYHAVEKNWKTHRGIAAEPTLNTFVQNAIGDYIRKRLQKFGVDLRYGQSLNRDAARRGSITGGSATLDLSSASDTVSKTIVLDLLPLGWVEFLSKYRAAFIKLPDGKMFLQSKFSSMGNGFTFPLETIIFYSLAKASAEAVGRGDEEVLCYGDDLIVPSEAFLLLSEVLTACGFRVNASKSYASGPFRESCGGDYFNGINVRPVYIKDRVSTCDLFVLHNWFYRNYDFEMCEHISSFLHPDVRLYGPDGYGDGHLIGDWEGRPYRARRGYGGLTFETYVSIPARVSQHADVQSYALYQASRLGKGLSHHLGEERDSWGHKFHEKFYSSDTFLEPADYQESHEGQEGVCSTSYVNSVTSGTVGWRRTKVYTFVRP